MDILEEFRYASHGYALRDSARKRQVDAPVTAELAAHYQQFDNRRSGAHGIPDDDPEAYRYYMQPTASTVGASPLHELRHEERSQRHGEYRDAIAHSALPTIGGTTVPMQPSIFPH